MSLPLPSQAESQSIPPDQKYLESQVLPIKLYLKIFFLIFALLGVNLFVYLTHILPQYNTAIFLSVASVQTLLVVLFFMELIHEDKFYFFIFISCILFILLFVIISLLEIPGRNFFHVDEGVHVLRGYDQQGVYAPSAPTLNNSKESE